MLNITIIPDVGTGYIWDAREPDGTVIARGEPCVNDTAARAAVKRLFGGSCAPEPVDVTIRYRNGTTEREWIR